VPPLRAGVRLPRIRSRVRDALALEARGLTVSLGGATALDEVGFAVPGGTTVAVLGPNGAGKTTLLRCIAGLIRPQRGSVELRGARLAFMPQRLELEPGFPVTAGDVVRMGRFRDLGWVRRFSARDRQLVVEALREVGIEDLADRPFHSLSGGERQRALLAQAVVQDADLMLFDEPFAGVDEPTRAAIAALLRRWSEGGRTVVVTTHDLLRARDYDLVLCLNRRLVTFGPPDAVLTEEVLAATFAGGIVRFGDLMLDVAHRHGRAG
jgi:ABC-type Mn2+/Zn2+ transport system ATPase subunit